MALHEGTGSSSGQVLAPPAPLPAAKAGAQVAAQPTGVVAFVGRCLKGPVNDPVAIDWCLDHGATLPEHQPQPNVRVLLAPAGHPFCLFGGAV